MSEDTEREARERVGCVLDDKWTLDRLLGVGGMAAVYAATHRNGARAAVKVLHPELSRHKEVRERFLREGYAANRVEHAGAVKVLDDDVVVSGPESGTAYIVMELLDGESLQDRLERSPAMGELEFLMLASSVLDVLDAAHSRGVVHRDLKPENLFLLRASDDPASTRPRVKVLDFGLARIVQGQALTTYGLALGTPSFMSPEQAAGRIDEIDGRTDLFALAATGFRICAGRRIHEAANPVDLVRKMATLAAPRIRTVRADVSEACARVLDRALEFRREDRYATAAAMREDVERAIAEVQVRGPTLLAVTTASGSIPSAFESASSGAQPTVELSARDLESSRPPIEESIRLPRNRGPLLWVGLVVAGAAAAAALWVHHRTGVSAGEASTLAPAPSAPVAPSPASAAPANVEAPVVVRDPDARADTPDAAPSPASAPAHADHVAAGTPPPIVPTTRATHHASPGKAGPGNVHKLPRKHRSKSRPTQG